MSADAASTIKESQPEARGPAPAIIVHHLNNSRSQRILWLLEELEVPYEIKFYQRGKDLLAPKELRDVHPLGKSPVITDTDGNVTVAESGAIIAYIIKKYGNGKAQPPASGEVDDLYSQDASRVHRSASREARRLVCGRRGADQRGLYDILRARELAAHAPESLGPKTKEWIKRVQDRPAYKRGLDKGGEYNYANAAAKL
ncbi:hypothetical protein EWM64_g8846 [Hericium alpestre]|uniref:glutathione transferase n=1 Tax=Hericium alpestre TaxID=135208 RepID=A0A4Y9ZKP3_9AGAM|nr:hypothetical protein EWM64_g8846 [Hericium alpestre]